MEITDGRLGTFSYMSPESCNPPFLFSYKSDIWSMAATMFEVFTGKMFCKYSLHKECINFCSSSRDISCQVKELPEELKQLLLPFFSVNRDERPDIFPFFSCNPVWEKYDLTFNTLRKIKQLFGYFVRFPLFKFFLVSAQAKMINSIYVEPVHHENIDLCEDSENLDWNDWNTKQFPYLGFYHESESAKSLKSSIHCI